MEVFTRILVFWSLLQSIINEGIIQPSHSVAIIKEYKGIKREGGTPDGNSYFKFIEEAGYIVDKSLLLKEVLFTARNLKVIIYPKRWGKTLNLNMIADFFRMEIEANGSRREQNNTASFQLFRHGKIRLSNGKMGNLEPPLLISKDTEFITQYAAQYPVLRMSFHFNTSSEKAFLHSFKSEIRKVFNEWSPCLILILDDDDLEIYHQYQDIDMKDETITGSLYFLTGLFKTYLKYKVIIVIDDYDYVHNQLYLYKKCPEGTDLIKSILSDFIMITFKKENSNILLGVLTGVLNIVPNYFSELSGATNDANIFDKTFNPYYGFSEEETAKLLQIYQPLYVYKNGTVKENVKFLYDGYLGETEAQIFHRYNAYSVTNLAKTGQLEVNWIKSGIMDNNVANFFYIPEFRSSVIKMILREELKFSIPDDLRFSKDDFYSVNNYLDEMNKMRANYQYKEYDRPDAYEITRRCMELLLSNGYLTGRLIKYGYTSIALLTVPNTEVAHWLTRMYMRYQVLEVETHETELRLISKSLCDYLVIQNKTSEQFQTDFAIFLKKQKKIKDVKEFTLDDEEVIFGNEAFAHHVLTAAALYIRCNSEGFDIRLSFSKRQPNLVFIWPTKVIVIDMKFEADVHKGLSQAIGYTGNILYEIIYPPRRDIKTTVVFNFQYIAINIDSEKKVELLENISSVVCSKEGRETFFNRLKSTKKP